MLKAKDGDFFLSDWLRNRNTVEFLGVWESIYNQAGLNSYKLSATVLQRFEADVLGLLSNGEIL
jgi:hypothetical protein